MTLVETVAGLGLLAAVLTLVFTARSHVARQQVRADRREAAVAATDALLAAWWPDAATFPRSGGGAVPGRPGLVWRTAVVPNPAAEALGSQAVRLEVTGVGPPTAEVWPVVTVEVVLPVGPPPARPTTAAAERPPGGRPTPTGRPAR